MARILLAACAGLSTLVALLGCLATAAASASSARSGCRSLAPPGWVSTGTTVNVHGAKRTALTWAVPGAWNQSVDSFTGGTAVGSPRTKASSSASDLGSFRSARTFFDDERVRTLAFYKKYDPRAREQGAGVVHLPGTAALHVTIELSLTYGQQLGPRRLWLDEYFVFHQGVGYVVAYVGLRSLRSIDAPVFDRSARTIQFLSCTPTPGA